MCVMSNLTKLFFRPSQLLLFLPGVGYRKRKSESGEPLVFCCDAFSYGVVVKAYVAGVFFL